MKTLSLYIAIITIFIFSPYHGNTQNFILVTSPNVASCVDFSIIDKNRNTIDLPKHISEALKCASVADLTKNVLTFMNDKSIILFDLVSQKEIKLFTLYPGMDGISNPAWSVDQSKIMFVIVNQQKKHGYTNIARIISVTLDENLAVRAKDKYDRPVHFVCGGTCQSEPYHDFKYTPEGIQYRRNENIVVRPGEFDLL